MTFHVPRKKGRPPKAGPRYPNGERRNPDPQDADPQATVRAQRVREVGEKHAMDERAGFLAGRLRLANAISERQFDAAVRLARVLRAHALVIGGKLPLPAGMRFDCMPDKVEVRADTHPDPRTEDERIASIRDAHTRCKLALLRVGLYAREIAEDVALAEEKALMWRGKTEQLYWLRRALEAVADVFGLEKGGK